MLRWELCQYVCRDIQFRDSPAPGDVQDRVPFVGGDFAGIVCWDVWLRDSLVPGDIWNRVPLVGGDWSELFIGTFGLGIPLLRRMFGTEFPCFPARASVSDNDRFRWRLASF